MQARRVILSTRIAGAAFAGASAAQAIAAESLCGDLPAAIGGRRFICADIAALDALLTCNRFGSYNPFGMLFALRRDLVASDTPPAPGARTARHCAADTGTAKALTDLQPGRVRLRDCKRLRPMVLRANVGDLQVMSVLNLLRPDPPGHSENFCRQAGTPPGTLAAGVRAALSEGNPAAVKRHEAACATGSAAEPPGTADAANGEWPRTRLLNFAIQGLVAISAPPELQGDAHLADADLRACQDLTAIPLGETVACFFEIDVAASPFLSSNAAPSGGEGDGGSITHGLFGAVIVQDKGAEWYRSQVSQAAMDLAWPPVERDVAARLRTGDHRRIEGVKYDAVSEQPDGSRIPVLAVLTPENGGAREIVHSDLNAIVRQPDGTSFRAFSVFFHDARRCSR